MTNLCSLVRSDSLVDTNSTGQGNFDLEPIIPESDDERSAPRRQRKKSKPVLPTTSSKIASLASATMSNPKMRLGELAAREYEFCPLQAVTKYPYRYLNKADSEAVSNLFFAAGRFQARGWSL